MTTGPADAARMGWRMSPLGYAWHFTRGAFYMPPHLVMLAEALIDIAMGRCTRLIVTVPPRHGKSETISHYFPVWLLDLFPTLRIGLASYEATFASEWGWKVRSTIKENAAELRVRLAEDFAARSAWYTNAGGGMFTAGIGGPFTGRGFNVGIIDDPFKNYEEAFSITYRERAWNWYLTTLLPRMEPKGAIIVTMQRWHEDDIVGRLIEQMKSGEGDRWRIIHLPALAEEGDPLGRPVGTALWPQRYNEAYLAKMKRIQGTFLFNAQYQQSPSPAIGTILRRNWWRYYSQLPNVNRLTDWLQSWDMAFKETTTSSFVVGQVWARNEADKYLIDQVRDRMDFVTTISSVRAMTEKWPRAVAKLVEDKANGPAVINTLRRELTGLIAVTPDGSKESRAQAVSPEVESGNIWLPAPAVADWVQDFVDEAARFPVGPNDDQVDAFTQAILRYQNAYGSGDLPSRMADHRLRGRR